MSIGLLSLYNVRNNFNLCSTSQSFGSLARQYPDLNRLVAYVYNTYIMVDFRRPFLILKVISNTFWEGQKVKTKKLGVGRGSVAFPFKSNQIIRL